MADWKEIPVVTTKKRGVGKLMVIGVIILLVGAGIGAVLQPSLSELFGTQPQLWAPENARVELANIVAVKPDKTGVVLTLGVTINPNGKGRILEDTHQLKGFDFQLSHHLAVTVASKLTGVPLDDDGVGIKGVDILFEVSAPAEESVEISAIDGPSAGAAATLAVIAAIENSSLRTNAVITGTIMEDGSIGQIGGLYVVEDQNGGLHVLGKPAAAHEAGMKFLLVPKGQPVEYYEPFGWFWVSSYKTISFLQQCVDRMDWGLKIIEVETIGEAKEIMFE